MTVVDQWTGRHARALQAAMRLTNEAFAEHLGVSPRTVAKWRERPEMIPSPQLQEALDTSLKLAAADTKLRFTSNLGTAS
ncbi:MAG TPA: helix-turn-helix transcriptional regulator, partial [Kribbella sp.]